MNTIAVIACASAHVLAKLAGPMTQETPNAAQIEESTPIALTQSIDPNTIEVGNSIACLTPTPPNRTFGASFYRSFDLSQDPRITGDLLVGTVVVGVEDALHPSGEQEITIALHIDRDGGDPLLNDLVPLAEVTAVIKDQVERLVSVPIEARVPQGSMLVVEVWSPSYAGLSEAATFIIGSNSGGQTAPTYWRSPGCGFAQIIDVADPLVSGGFPDMHLVLTVEGEVDDTCYADCDPSSGRGVLDILDFVCFQDRFVAGDPYACDCTTASGAGVCDILDFLCFQDAFLQGCP